MRQSKYKFELRSLYCACVPLCYVASGNFDFNLCYSGMSIWDVIAPQLIIQEAGGICEISKDLNSKYSVIAGSKKTVKIIKQIITLQ